MQTQTSIGEEGGRFFSGSASSGDDAVMARVAAGDLAALGELYERYSGAAFALALRIVRDRGLAEDAVQEAFLSVWRSAAGFDPARGMARSWILTVAHRRAVDLVQGKSRLRERPLEPGAELAGPSSAESAAVSAERRGVQAALGSLPATERQALELAYYAGYTQSQIAERLAVPLGTVKSRVFSGLSRLRKRLGEPATVHP